MASLSLSDDQILAKRQIENTVEIINFSFDKQELSDTALYNALLSLVILPFERTKRRNGERIWQGSYNDIKKEMGFNEILFKPIKKDKQGYCKNANHTMYEFIKNFRNSIAHQNVQICVDENRHISVVFFNVFPVCCNKCANCKDCNFKNQHRGDFITKNNGLENFRVSFTFNQLHKFAVFIANRYLYTITGEKKKD